MSDQSLILASGSAVRQKMLRNAGLNFDVVPAGIDENIDKAAPLSPEDLAMTLAQKKAQHVSRKYPSSYVIGADQVLVCENTVFSKAENVEAAKEKLRMLRGKTHSLMSGVAVAHKGEVLWSYLGQVHLTMHNFDDAFLDRYCMRAGEALTRSVGAYEYESHGAWLFEQVDGDYFTILGMPLLPLLSFLKQQGLGP